MVQPTLKGLKEVHDVAEAAFVASSICSVNEFPRMVRTSWQLRDPVQLLSSIHANKKKNWLDLLHDLKASLKASLVIEGVNVLVSLRPFM